MKTLLLLTLTAYTSFTTYILHRSRNVPASDQYLSATSVVMGELVKLSISVALLYKDNWYQDSSHQLPNTKKDLINTESEISLIEIFKRVCDKDILRIVFPASLYVIQSMFQLTGMMYLSPLTYQTLSQFKIIAVASLSTFLLGKRLNSRHWIAIFTLLIGVIMVQMNARASLIHRLVKKDILPDIKPVGIDVFIGPIFILVSCFLGSLGGILLEKKIKRDSRPGALWIFNAQLSIISLLPAFCILLSECYQKGVSNPFINFSSLAWITVFARAGGGILVALILKHADNILKAFATCAAILLTLCVTAISYGIYPSYHVCIGAAMVITSTVGYAIAEQQEKQTAQMPMEKS
ncbi:uncharacterized protein FA14DRAFT_128289 [Meira miltonrushii]|uniref:Nucleotide-sugar transporter n=1 Tax=Meira miltonrushii TaxID=1280837 RepID=A0A316V1F0_9BASI|nr:uncharacterized protein FA14DRAFT_128289 [Meira miltonrushii]PWN31380.1 hypothetical protein FA14DRAFT_128289 [Meira miltonrushii]